MSASRRPAVAQWWGQPGALLNSDQGNDEVSAENVCSERTADSRWRWVGASPTGGEMAGLSLKSKWSQMGPK